MRQEDLRGLFYIVRGNYSQKEPKVACGDGTEKYIGGYNPEGDKEWYRVLDNEVFFCSYAGGDYDKALEVIEHQITHFKSRKKYFKWVSEVSSEDYYFTHYLGRAPFNHDQYLRRTEGRQPRVSFAMKSMERAIYDMWGHYFDEDIEVIEDRAYDTIEEREKVFEKKRSRLKSLKKKVVVVENSTKKPENKPLEKKINRGNTLKKRIKLK